MTGNVRILWYTDPHDVWCWGCEPAMRRFEVLYPDSAAVETRMGGLFEDFSPVREQWARMSGGRWKDSVLAFFEAVASQHRMPMDGPRMVESSDDFGSTWPACLAVKAAELQGKETGRRYLRRLREAWFLDGRGIHQRSVQEEVAARVGMDVDAFRAALGDGSAERVFRADREECRDLAITGFPTFVLEAEDESVRLEGWQPWEVFDEAVRKLGARPRPENVKATTAGVRELLQRFGLCATREIAAVLGATDDDAEILLEELEGTGKVTRRPVGSGLMWELRGRETSIEVD